MYPLLQLSLQYLHQPKQPLGSPEDPKIFKQNIDHFAFNANRLKTFNQRYFINELFITNPGQINTALLKIGAEDTVHSAPGGNLTHFDLLGELSLKFNAPIFELEHRFYGESQPFAEDNNPLKTENLKYLSARYAIADLVNFVTKIDQEYCAGLGMTKVPGKTCLKWMVIGGSYAGAVSAWIAQQHPHLFAATISSSGVVNVKYENPEFDTHTYAAAGTPCAQAYVHSMREIEKVTESGDDKYLDLFQATRKNLPDFYYFLADTSLMAIQYGSWKEMCQNNLQQAWSKSSDVTEAFVSYLKQNYEYKYYDRDVLKKDEMTLDMNRQWWYQTCTEFAYYQPAPKYNNIRSQHVTMQWHLDICQYIFDLQLGDPTERTNNYFGNTLVYGENTFFSNFWQDIWHILGITKQTLNVKTENIGYINSRDSGHCQDMHLYNNNDPEALKTLRQNEIQFVSNKFFEWTQRE
ncbi:Serine_peptidase [Hexamita inflata]|uniref:Serine peptidase n=2 Tax=Hexamita inflata TaxID=28002 RepID=A0AA86PIT0_9EUKA|nr:Serine peptidase [Hexamita inflata]